MCMPYLICFPFLWLFLSLSSLSFSRYLSLSRALLSVNKTELLHWWQKKTVCLTALPSTNLLEIAIQAKIFELAPTNLSRLTMCNNFCRLKIVNSYHFVSGKEFEWKTCIQFKYGAIISRTKNLVHECSTSKTIQLELLISFTMEINC